MNPTDLTTEQFVWSPKHNRLSADASDLNLPPGGYPAWMMVKSHWTGKLKVFQCKNISKNREGEVLHVEYRSPGCDVQMIVFND